MTKEDMTNNLGKMIKKAVRLPPIANRALPAMTNEI
jgi:hypothetical protein